MRFQGNDLWIHVVRCGVVLFFLSIAVGQNPDIANAQSQSISQPAQHVYRPGELNTEFSRVYVFVGKSGLGGLGHEHAVEGKIKSAVIHLGATENAGEMVFDMGSFTADTDRARKAIGLEGETSASTQHKVNANMLGPEVLATTQFPTASYKIRSIRLHPQKSKKGLPQYQFDGDFTLHGVTRRTQVVAQVEEKNGWYHITGGFGMLQSQFGITPYTTMMGAIGVADGLKVYGDLWVAK